MRQFLSASCVRAWVVVSALLLLAPPLRAGETSEGAVPVRGKIAIAKHNGWDVLAATLTRKDGSVLHIVPDEKGCDFAKVMFGREVEILGVISQKDGKTWLKVVGYGRAEDTSAHELWRRMRCNACVVQFAGRHAAVPAEDELGALTPISGRHFANKGKFTAWTRDARSLWLATDTAVLQVDLKQSKLLRSYGIENGLPDRAIYRLESNGKTLWVVHRGGVAALEIGSGKIVDLPRLKARFARVFCDAASTWVVTDTGTFRLKAPADVLTSGPAIPTGQRIGRIVERGLWVGHWQEKTRHFITALVSVGDRLYVGSYGDIYEFADGRWRKIARRAWELSVGGDRVWFVSAQGLVAYDPQTQKSTTHVPPEVSQGRYTGLLPAGGAAWVTAEPKVLPDSEKVVGGGLARLDCASGTWRTWQTINGHQADHARCFQAHNGEIWAVTLEGKYTIKGAHPGMSYVKRKTFNTTGFYLHRLQAKGDTWESFRLPFTPFEDRLICGQDGGSGRDTILPQFVEGICVGPTRILGILRLLPSQFFSGYWPSICELARRESTDVPWTGKFEHHPEQLNLQGEQPLVLNISNKGQMILEAVGHDSVLALFFLDGTYWAVTEGCAAVLDPDAGTWRKITESRFRFYWRATAALDDGRSLYLGSDRGVISRLDFATGRFEILAALKDRGISRIVKDKNGDVLVAARPAPIGMLPVPLRGKPEPMDCDAVRFDGKTWTAARPDQLPEAKAEAQWLIKPLVDKAHPAKRFLRDKSRGNRLWGPGKGGAASEPRFYVKEVFSPEFLCAGPDGRRLWLATFCGLLRLDLDGKP